jgi:hypothetical protein
MSGSLGTAAIGLLLAFILLVHNWRRAERRRELADAEAAARLPPLDPADRCWGCVHWTPIGDGKWGDCALRKPVEEKFERCEKQERRRPVVVL